MKTNPIRKEIRRILNEIFDNTSVKDKDVRKKVMSEFVNNIIGHKIGEFSLIECKPKDESKLRQAASNPKLKIYLYADLIFFEKYYAHDDFLNIWYEVWSNSQLSETISF